MSAINVVEAPQGSLLVASLTFASVLERLSTAFCAFLTYDLTSQSDKLLNPLLMSIVVAVPGWRVCCCRCCVSSPVQSSPGCFVFVVVNVAIFDFAAGISWLVKSDYFTLLNGSIHYRREMHLVHSNVVADSVSLVLADTLTDPGDVPDLLFPGLKHCPYCGVCELLG